METTRNTSQLVRFLQQELDLSDASIAMAQRQSEQGHGPLHMILWKYGLVSIEQLEQIFDWMEN